MKISLNNLLVGVLATAFVHVSLNAFEPEIKLTGRKDLVLGIESRQTVLRLGEEFLSTPTGDYLPVIEDLRDPFSFEDVSLAPPVVAEDVAEPEEVPELPAIDYDDAEVLALSAPRFAKKVRGAIVRGDSSFLQLEGGALLKPGTSFPVRLPQAKQQTYILTITEITSEGYTLRIGEATRFLNFDNSSQSDPNSIKYSNPQ